MKKKKLLTCTPGQRLTQHVSKPRNCIHFVSVRYIFLLWILQILPEYNLVCVSVTEFGLKQGFGFGSGSW